MKTLKKEMSYQNKGSLYPDLKRDTSVSKAGWDELKQLAQQLESEFATKIDLKDKNLEAEIENFFILNT